MRVFLTGGDGQLGRALRRILSAYDLVAPSESEADISDPRVARLIADARPDLVIHTAAYTDVDGAEAHPDRAFAVNALGSRHVAQGAADARARLIAVSTDYVYDGTKDGPYREDDPVAPLGMYGASKLEGEREILKAKPDAVILRTAWLYGEGKNFVETILRLARERDELRIVDDQRGSPTAAADLATVIAALWRTPCTGVYHAVNAGACSWFEFAREILRLAGLDRRVVPIRSSELVRPAKRPANSVLDCGKLAVLGITLRPWQDALRAYFRERGPVAP
ncbi:MAG: dTDP-4-dehydrorhamnose reductase [Nitrospirae bacterium]|nr:dTDP-4-dehydrorhamnose reductase [Nitrospirota bacterium]